MSEEQLRLLLELVRQEMEREQVSESYQEELALIEKLLEMQLLKLQVRQHVERRDAARRREQ